MHRFTSSSSNAVTATPPSTATSSPNSNPPISERSKYPKSWPRVDGWTCGYRFDDTDPATAAGDQTSEAVSSPAATHDELANQESIVPPSTTLRAPTGDADDVIFDEEGWGF